MCNSLDKMRDVSRNIRAVIDLSVVWRELMRNFLEQEHKVVTHAHTHTVTHTVSANTKRSMHASDVRKRTKKNSNNYNSNTCDTVRWIRNILITTTNWQTLLFEKNPWKLNPGFSCGGSNVEFWEANRHIYFNISWNFSQKPNWDKKRTLIRLNLLCYWKEGTLYMCSLPRNRKRSWYAIECPVGML